jgi:MoaA/NifB/PqqE/SkfB family radical SAM enzyme
MEAISNAHKSGIVAALSLCATRSFVNYDNLVDYMELAKNLGVAFVQILEPRAVGRYHGQDVALSPEQIQLLEQIYLEYNNSKVYADYPIIQFLGYHQRKSGCFGAGDRFFYINTEGEAQICPYCSGGVADARSIDPDKMIDLLSYKSCHQFRKNELF